MAAVHQTGVMGSFLSKIFLPAALCLVVYGVGSCSHRDIPGVGVTPTPTAQAPAAAPKP